MEVRSVGTAAISAPAIRTVREGPEPGRRQGDVVPIGVRTTPRRICRVRLQGNVAVVPGAAAGQALVVASA